MKFFIKFKAQRTITDRPDIKVLKDEFEKAMDQIFASDKAVHIGMFADQRGGYMVLDVQSSEQLLNLLGPTFLDFFDLEVHPLVAFDAMREFFQKND